MITSKLEKKMINNNKPKILFAFPHSYLQLILKEPKITDNFQIISAEEEINRQNLLKIIQHEKPQIVTIPETIKGEESLNYLIKNIRLQDIRVIFLCSNRKRGDILLSNLVLYGITDIINRDSISTKELAKILLNPQPWSQVATYIRPIKEVVNNVPIYEKSNLNENQIKIKNIQGNLSKRKIQSNKKTNFFAKIFNFK